MLPNVFSLVGERCRAWERCVELHSLRGKITLPLLAVPRDPAVLKLRSLDRAELKLVSDSSVRGEPLGDWNVPPLR